jgi:uncharacterized FAD-dependent dehydrogenase
LSSLFVATALTLSRFNRTCFIFLYLSFIHNTLFYDQCRFGDFAGHELLGAADYKLVHHCKNGRSVYSFCMCPGGTVVAATSAEGHIVTNGMSQYSRNERNANSAIVVGIEPEKDIARSLTCWIKTLRINTLQTATIPFQAYKITQGSL